MKEIHSKDYHDFVFKNGKLVGEFEQMYQKSRDIPWHQDKAVLETECKIASVILSGKAPYRNILDVGCGLGYLTNTFTKYSQKVIGVDVSETAIKKAKIKFPKIEFSQLDISIPLHTQSFLKDTFHCVFIRAIFWYVFPALETVVKNLNELVDTNGYLVIHQNFPPLDSNFIGKNVISSPTNLAHTFSPYFEILQYNWFENRERNQNDNWVTILLIKK